MFSRDTIVAAKLLPSILLLTLTMGCASIQSDPVRKLIEIQGEHIKAAEAESVAFEKQTKARIDEYKQSVKDLDDALQNVQLSEAQHALIFSANQNIRSKTGVDANAAAYMIGGLYFADYAGLQKEVEDQFDADFKALQQLGFKIKQSWSAIAKLHIKIEDYSKKSVLSSVDADFIASLLQQTRIDTADIDGVIKASKQLNSTLGKVSNVRPVQGKAIDTGQRMSSELIDLLERIKQAPKK